MNLCELDVFDLHKEIKKKSVSVRDVCQSALNRINEVEEKVAAFYTVTYEGALERAAEVDAEIARGREIAYLTGIPLAIKDIISTRGIKTTCGSKILENYVPPYDAHVVEKLKAEGMVLIGKTSMDEFGMGSSSENSAFKIPRNPWDTTRVAGGSSGGSAVAVTAYEAAGALGSDTGGSIRLPAALCGAVGLKPTYGRVSRYGLVAFASSLDTIGPLGRSVRDVAILLQAIAGHDSRDSTSVDRPVPDYVAGIERDVKGIRVGLPKEFFGEGLDREVGERVKAAIKILQRLGCEITDIQLPHTEYAIATYYIIAPAEASANLARYDGVKYGLRASEAKELTEMYQLTRSRGFGAEVKRRIMIGTYVLSAGYYDAYYLKAQKVRTLIKRDYEDAFKKVDLIVTPTSPTPAFRLGERASDPLTMYLSDIYTVTVNLAGIPALSVPCGVTPDGLPVGMQIMGNYFDEERVLQLAYAYEQAADYERPTLKLTAT